jgi:K+-transporting ATPase ATPase C chain
MFQSLRSAVLIYAAMTLLTGVIYPLAVTGVAQVVFPRQANGSLVVVGEKPVGSALIGQSFDDPRYFWGRPSATAPAYNGAASSGSNLGPTNQALTDRISARVKELRAAHPSQTGDVPVDLVTTSGSGLDPEISPAAAVYQIERVAAARGLKLDRVKSLVEEHTQSRTLGVLGEPRVNVLELNLALDEVK